MQRYHFPSIDSTNDEALRLLEGGAEPPFVIRADEQTAGRGRRGRMWYSPPGGLWMTVAWPLRLAPGVAAEAASLVTGLALAEAIEPELSRGRPGSTPVGENSPTSASMPADGAARPTRSPLEIKWPNDLLLHRRKIAGVLCERRLPTQPPARTGAPEGSLKAIAPAVADTLRETNAASTPDLLLIGVGVNVNLEAAELPRHLEFPADSLKNTLGRPVSIEGVFERFVTRLSEHLTTFCETGLTSAFRDAISGRLAFVGENVEITVPVARDRPPVEDHPEDESNGTSADSGASSMTSGSPADETATPTAATPVEDAEQGRIEELRPTVPAPTESARQLRGRLLGLDNSGRLLIEEAETHAIHACHSGEVRWLRPG